MRKYVFIALIPFLACMGVLASAYAQEQAEEMVVEMVTPAQDALLGRYEKGDKEFKRLEIDKIKIVSYFHRRKIGEAIVEGDFIRYQFNTETEELIEQTKRWREGLPEQVDPVIARAQAESMVEGEVQFARLYFIAPDSDVYPIKPTPKNPCWVVRSIVDGEGLVVTVIDAMTGENLGHGVPPPYEGFSLGGPNWGSCAPYYTAWAQNAETWFENMGYNTEMVDCPTDAKVQSHIQSDSTVMFYELAHGDSLSFHNECPDTHKITAAEVETWMGSYASMGFTFLGSCGGMCDQTDNHLSFEFRQGSGIDTVAVGYCDMAHADCADCWDVSIPWQTTLFDWMDDGYAVWYAFYRANLAYPDCTDLRDCVRTAGDTNMRFAGASDVPKARRSFCGAIYNPSPFYLSPFPAVQATSNTRAHHIRCNSSVPSGYFLTIGTSASYPYNEVAFVNNSKLTATGPLTVSAVDGVITFVSAFSRSKGMKVTGGQLNMVNGGTIKIYE